MRIFIFLLIVFMAMPCIAENMMVFYKKADNSVIWTYSTNGKFVYSADDQLNIVVSKFGGNKSNYGYATVSGDFSDVKDIKIKNGKVELVYGKGAARQIQKNKEEEEKKDAIDKLKALGLSDTDLRALQIR